VHCCSEVAGLLKAAQYRKVYRVHNPEMKDLVMSYEDQTLYCRDCNQAFTFTQGEQEFYASRGLMNSPTRCPSCRATRKQAGGGRGPVSRGQSSGGGGFRDREPRQMYTITCDSCGNEAQVPFQPRGDRPTYCSDCYQAQRASRSGDRRSDW